MKQQKWRVTNVKYKKTHQLFLKKIRLVHLPWRELGILHHPPELIFGLHQLVLLLFPFFLGPCLHVLIKHLHGHDHTSTQGSAEHVCTK